MATTTDEASRLAALLQEGEEEEEESFLSMKPTDQGEIRHEIDIEEILQTYCNDDGDSRKSSLDEDGANRIIDDLLSLPSPQQQQPQQQQPPPPQVVSVKEAEQTRSGEAKPQTGGGFLSLLKGAVTMAAGETTGGKERGAGQQLGALAGRLQSSLRKTVGGITSGPKGQGQEETAVGAGAAASQSPKASQTSSIDGSSSIGGGVLAFASQMASTIGESVGGAVGSVAGGGGGSDQGVAAGLSQLSEDFVEVDSHQISLWAYLSSAHPVRSVEVKLRPDVSQDSILGLFETMVLSHGLVVKERGAGSLTVERSGGGGKWNMVLVKMGVNRSKVRILLLQFFADPKLLSLPSKATPPSPPATSTTTSSSSASLGAQLVESLGSALLEGNMTLSTLPKDEAVVVELDPLYVRDLQVMFAAEMMESLASYAGPLDAYVKEQELRCARLMTTLQPIYGRSRVEIPRPCRAKALHSFPLDTSRPPVSEASMHSAAHILSKVQSQYRKERVMEVVRRVWKELQEWCDEESRARVKRKNQQVASRLKNVEQHGEALVSTLRDSPQVQQSPMDKQLAASFPMAAGEAVIFDCAASLSSRPGRLFITSTHLWFHSQILGFTLQKALPMSSIAMVERPGASAMPLAGKTVTVVDKGGERHSLLITALDPPDSVDRVYDVLTLVLECWRRGSASNNSHDSGSGPGTDNRGSDDVKMDKDEDVVERFKSIGMAEELTPSPSSYQTQGKQQQQQPEDDEDHQSAGPRSRSSSGGSGSQDQEPRSAGTGTEAMAPVSSSSSSPPPLPPPVPSATSTGEGAAIDASRRRSGSLGSVGGGMDTSGSVPPRPRSIRSGIQAFLTESQGVAPPPKKTSEEPLLDFS